MSLKSNLADKLHHAIEIHQQGKLDVAEKNYRDLLKKQPSNPDLLHFYGILLHQRGQSDKAIACIRRCLGLVPDYLDARINLGNVYQESGELEKAADVFFKIIKKHPQQAKAYNNLGVTLRKLKRPDESVIYLQKAVELASDQADFYQNLANSYQDLENYAAASDAYRCSIRLKPKQNDAYYHLWLMLRRKAQQQLADEVVAEWLIVDPDNPIAQHHFAATQIDNIPERASDAYVIQTFDKFAASFDEVLKNLDYRAPQCISEAVQSYFGKPEGNLRILDAGCGTGLCGTFLNPYANSLFGVDLSSAMLNKAQGRGLYHELVESDLVAYLQQQSQTFDLIVSADTLCYFGCLQTFCLSSQQALVADGVLIFTVEDCQDQQVATFKLNAHGRYSHRREYIEQVLQQTGFSLLRIETVFLRNEGGLPVEGLLVTAVRDKQNL